MSEEMQKGTSSHIEELKEENEELEKKNEELRKKIVQSLEAQVEKNHPGSRLVKTLVGVVVAYAGANFDYGLLDEMMTIGSFGYMGWNVAGMINYFIAKNALKGYKEKCSGNKDGCKGCGCQ